MSLLPAALLLVLVCTGAPVQADPGERSVGASPTGPTEPTGDEVGRWSEAAEMPGPDGRVYPQVSASAELGLAVVFGGATEHGMDNDTYWLDMRTPSSEWQTLDADAPAPPPRANAAVAWDPEGHRMLMFGGSGQLQIREAAVLFGAGFLNDVWALQFDPSGTLPPHWEELDPGGPQAIESPSRRAGAAAVYDPVGDRMIVHGGNATVGSYLGVAGEIAEGWTGVPNSVEQALDEVWSFDLATSTWTKLSGGLPGGEPNLFQHQAAYDPVHRQLVVTGGATGNDPYSNDLEYNPLAWSFDLSTNVWTSWSPEGDSPAMVGGAYGYSDSLGALVVARGQFSWQSEIDKAPVYALTLGPGGQGSEWNPLSSSGLPFPITPFGGGASGAVAGDTLVVMGGSHLWSSDQGWDHDARLSAFDIPSRRWRTLASDGASMNPTRAATAVYDSARRHMLVVGGRGRPGRVWDLDLETGAWKRIAAPGPRPNGEKRLGAAYDSTRERLLVAVADRVHALDLSGHPRWSLLDPLGEAPSLKDASAVYDPVRDRLLLITGLFTEPEYDTYFGSWQQSDYSQKVFALHLSGTPAWRELSPQGPSPERRGAGVVYDPVDDRVLLFGGRDGSTGTLLNDVLELSLEDGGTWRTVSAAGTAPAAREDAVVTYDAANTRLLVYGGTRTDPATYALSLAGAPAWSKLTTTGDPAGREEATGVYDPAGSRLVVFGGSVDGDNTVLAGTRETYALPVDGSAPAWPQAEPQTYTPPVPGPVRGGTWSTLGPAGARTMPVALSPSFAQDGTIYAGTVGSPKTEDVATGISVSRDRGATWRGAGGSVQGAAVVRIAPSLSNADVVYASTRADETGVPIHVSRDRGSTWAGASNGLPSGSYFALEAHPSQPAVAWAGGDGGGMYRTADGGESWQPIGFEDEWVYGVTAIPLPQGVRLLAATRNPSSNIHGSGRVFLSDDLGATWDLVYSNENYVTYGFAYDPSTPTRVLLSSGNGIWRSLDGGATWEWVLDRAIHAADLAFDPTSGGEVVYAAGVALPVNFHGFAGGEVSPAQTPGLFRSNDGGETWTRLPSTPEEDFGGVAVDAAGSFVVGTSLESGPHLSTNGTTFEPSTAGFTQFVTAAIAVDAGNPSHLVAATEYDGARVSEDGGLTWARRGPADGEPLWYVAASPVKPGRLLGGNYSSLYKSENGGRTWSKVPLDGNAGMPYRQPGGVAFHPSDADTWYLTMNNGKAAVTRDNGSSFAYSDFGGRTCPVPIATSSAAPNTVLLADICGSGVWRSDDAGATWSSSTAGLDDGSVTALAFHPTDPNVAWAGTLHRGVYRSDDGGRTWRPARVGLGYRYVRFLSVDEEGRIYAAVRNAGVFESDDGGASWMPINGGLTNQDPIHVLAHPSGQVLVATRGGGVARLVPAA